MKKKSSGKSRGYFLIIMCLVCVLMIGSSFAMLSNYSGTIERESGEVALSFVEGAANNLKSSIDAFKMKAKSLADTVAGMEYESDIDFATRLHRLSKDERFGDVMFVRFFNNDKEYDVSGQVFESEMEAPAVKKTAELRTLSCAGVIADRQYNLSTVAFCVPIDGFDYADMLVVCYPVTSVVTYSASYTTENYENSRFVAFCAAQGEIVRVLYRDENVDVQQHGNIYEILRNEINDKNILDGFRVNVEAGTSEKYTVDVAGDKCIISVCGVRENGNAIFSAVGYYMAEEIYKTGYDVMRVILGEFFVFFALALALGIYGIIERRNNRKLLSTMNDVNKAVGCYSRSKFERVAIEIISRNKATSFAIVVIDINHYDYILEQIGTETMLNIVRHLKVLYNGILGLDESLGYIENGRFALLLHYRQVGDLADRLLPVVALATQHSSQFTDSFSLVLQGGIYTTDRKIADTVTKMIDLAINAENATKFPCDFGSFRIYNETLYASNIQNDYIETHMESALQNHDFKVFYQAKYNIAEDRPDGCEALVRWYNPSRDEYMQPDVFLPLFEANRFIIKLDHYVFEQTCLYIQDAVINGLPLYPISVNASRITASEKDFVKFYTDMKHQYNIADGFITIEFTESFAYEDYDMLRSIVNELHKNGFKCSIDDFGSGFSSYNILKELPMDEIKLDRFFIKDGYSHDRDMKILSSIISLARDLHMKVTQDGVETQEQVDLLRKLGCQVVQGYYYSKPLALTDYIGFLSNEKKLK